MLNFENKVLKLAEIMVPPMMSSVMSGKNNNKNADNSGQQNNVKTEEVKTGRKEKPDNEKSDKTLANREAMG
jgi:hypothetical protein